MRRRLAELIPAALVPETLAIEKLADNCDRQFVDALFRVQTLLSEEIISPSDLGVVLDGGADVRERIANIVSSLSRKQQDVLYRRFGLQGHRTKTLDEIGNEFYVTRERVRQVEAGAIKRLQVGTRLNAFKQLQSAISAAGRPRQPWEAASTAAAM